MPCAHYLWWLLAIREEKSQRLHVRAEILLLIISGEMAAGGEQQQGHIHVQQCPPYPGCLQTASAQQRDADPRRA